MLVYSFLSLLFAFLCTLLGVLVYRARHRSPAAQSFFLCMLLLAGFGMALFFFFSQAEAYSSYWLRLALAFAAFAPVPFAMLNRALADRPAFHSLPFFLIFLTAVGCVLSVSLPALPFNRPGNFVSWNSPAWSQLWFYPRFLTLAVIGVLGLTVADWLREHGQRRIRSSYAAAGFLLSLGGVTAMVMSGDTLAVPGGFISSSLGCLVLACSLSRRRLPDLDTAVRKLLGFALLVSIMTVLLGTFLWFLGRIPGASSSWHPLAKHILAVFFLVIFFDPVRKLLGEITHRFLLERKYNYQKVLRDASRGMSRIENLDHLIKLVIHFATMRIRLANAAALLLAPSENHYVIHTLRGYGTEARRLKTQTWSATSPLMRFLAREKEVLDTDDVRDRAESAGKKALPEGHDFPAILAEMDALHAACIVPSFLGRDLRGLLVLGGKRSGDPFTEQDYSVLYTLAQESAMAIENARLHDEMLRKTRELDGINRERDYASKKLKAALNETEEANKRLRDTHAQLIHEQKMATLGRLAASVGHEVNNPLTILSMNVSRMVLRFRKDPNLKVADVMDFFTKMESNIQRIKAVVNTLTGLLKRSEKGKFEPLSLKLVIEETLPLVQFQTYLENLTGTEVEFDIPSNLPLINGDLERLQEIFLNLFTNAYHAMQRPEKKIRIAAQLDERNPRLIVVRFSDNGCGIDEDTMQKIFNYGYTTKDEGKGSGIGLYMCRYIIELHGGEIKVESKMDEGTTFTLTIPVYEEERRFGGEEKAMRSTG